MRLIGAGTRGDGPTVTRDTVLTWANLVTVLRLCGLPFFVYLVLVADDRIAALVVLIVIAGTDWVDGYLARRLDQVSRLGKILDPLANRLMMLVVSVTLAMASISFWWIVGAIAIPDLILAAASAVLFKGNPDLEITLIGKLRTACLMLGLPLMLLGSGPNTGIELAYVTGLVVTILGIVGHWVAGFQYLRSMRLASRKSSRAS